MNKKQSDTQLKDINQLLEILVKDLKERLSQLDSGKTFLVGIHSGGVWLAEHLHSALGLKNELGKLDISFYRDDFEQKGLHPEVKPSSLHFDVDDANIILVDDVVMTGRTIRAAMNEIFDYGRPACIVLASLVELDAQQLPIRSDICGQKLSLLPSQRVELCGPQPLSIRILEKP